MAEPNGATSGPVRVSVENDREAIARVETDILARVESLGYSKASVFAIKLAFEEAITNAFKHGHESVEGDPPVVVDYEIDESEVTIAIEDRGPGFDLWTIPDPTLDENLTVPSGRGLMLIRSYMTEVRHNASGNRVEMVYRRPAR
jgi:serine/threonine-protein kinase RsbW